MDFQHEGMEMDAAFGLDWRRGEEHIHQHGFAAPHIAIDIEALRRRLSAAAQAKALHPAFVALGRVVFQSIVQRLQLFRRQLLRRIAGQPAGGASRPVGR
jgi:hypothetical protein